jgi:hypothetical protein
MIRLSAAFMRRGAEEAVELEAEDTDAMVAEDSAPVCECIAGCKAGLT